MYSSERLAVAARELFAITIACSPSRTSRRTLRSAAFESAALCRAGELPRAPEAVEPPFEFEQAIEAYKKTLSLKPNAETSNNLGTVYFRTKRYQEAASAFKEAIRIKPDYGEAHFNLAVAYVALSDRKGALDEYNNLKTLDPRLADEFFKRFLKK